MIKHQRGLTLSGLLVWGVFLVVVAVFGMKVVPTYLEYYKIQKDTKAAVAQVGPEATVADVRKAFDRFAEIDADTDVISYCGSGVTACHNLIAMEYAGLGAKRLFPGSWSQYAATDRPAATGD